MKRLKTGFTSTIACLLIVNLSAQQVGKPVISVVYKNQAGAFPLVSNKNTATLYYDTTDATVVSIAMHAFAEDIGRITGVTPSAGSSQQGMTYTVLAGTIGRNKQIDGLVRSKKLKVNLAGKWETFTIAVVDNPFAGCKQALVIAGSDPRGTAFGIFELSKMLGTSPFCWWADINPQHRDELYITKGVLISKPPSVKYRGIFINDEDWGLQPWAAKTFEPETGDIGPRTYAKVFELLLRLKANMIWPAMHPSTKAFYYYPGNKQVAANYSIIIGSSHAEPMLRNNVSEWDKATMGDFNYLTNKERVYKYWEDRVKESSINDVIYTLGMRGIHDSGLEGIKDPKDAVPLIERIFTDQRGMLQKHINKNITKVPQVFTAYKEVLDIYDIGLKVPDDVTIVWPDDNYGYIQRLNDEKEKKRSGGSGVYYHASYWGRPHDYLWLSSTHPGLVREEMMKAYAAKADRLWVLNVGDIKPLEYNIQQFFDMAWDVTPFREASYTKQHMLDWLTGIFGKEHASVLEKTLSGYYRLAFERRPEFMGWSQTEPTTQTKNTAYNHYSYGDEAQKRIDKYTAYEKLVKELRPLIAEKDKDAFYQLVYYPVVCASLMNKKFLYRDKSYIYAKQNRLSASYYAKLSVQAYDEIVKETDYYNTQLAGGKWNHIMSMEPRKLPVYQKPVITSNITKGDGWDIAPEGYDSIAAGQKDALSLPAFDAANMQKYFIDIYLTSEESLNWGVTTSYSWIRVSKTSGTLVPSGDSSQVRVWVEMDWAKVPADGQSDGQIIFHGGGKQIAVGLHIKNTVDAELKDFNGYVENNGIISINALDYRSNASGRWEDVYGLGHRGWALKSVGTKADTTKSNSGFVTYDFYSLTGAVPVVNIYSLPTHPLNKDFSMRYGVSIDDSPMQVVDFRTYGRSEEWKQNVLRNSAIRKISLPFINRGKHTLKVYAIDPGVIIDRIVIDLGGLKNTYSVLP